MKPLFQLGWDTMYAVRMLNQLGALVAAGVICCGAQQLPKGWQQGKGYGWVYGSDDELGAIQAVTTPERVLAALRGVKTGKVYDLGVRVDRTSYKWPGHAPIEILSFRSPQGLGMTKDIGGFQEGKRNLGFNSGVLFMSDNVGTQIDTLAHISTGPDNHSYNGIRAAENSTDFGIRRADADSIPPIIARAVLIDVAADRGVKVLPSNFAIGPKELQSALKRQNMDVEPGDVVLIRTGTLGLWGSTGADHDRIAEHDSAGLTLAGAKWLVEQKGAVLVGSDTSGLEVGKDPEQPDRPTGVHEYLLVEQGVHVGEFHNLEELSRNRVYRFTYVALTNRLKGATAGTALRPIAIE
jgi:kynurenine formamidase